MAEGSQFFLPAENIATGSAWAHDELAKDGYLAGMDRKTFVRRLAYHYDNYNFIHPFREGNGRTQRLLWTLICHDAGFFLNWSLVSGEENDEASRLAAEELNRSALEKMFEKISEPTDPTIPINEGLLPAGHLDRERS